MPLRLRPKTLTVTFVSNDENDTGTRYKIDLFSSLETFHRPVWVTIVGCIGDRSCSDTSVLQRWSEGDEAVFNLLVGGKDSSLIVLIFNWIVYF